MVLKRHQVAMVKRGILWAVYRVPDALGGVPRGPNTD